MSMYNMVFGTNKAGAAILATLGLTPGAFGRYRDAGVADGKIFVYTRCGGGNREGYQEVFDEMAEHPCFEYDDDDDFDCTYCTFYFRFPDEFAEDLAKLDSGEPFEPSKRWHEAIDAITAAASK